MEARAVQSILVLSSLVLVTACNSPVSPLAATSSSSGVGGGGGSATTTTATTGTTTSSTGAGGADPYGVTTYTTGMGPISLAPGVEEVNCITIPLGNTEGGFVRSFRAQLSEGSHHMIVYTTSATTPAPTPTPCQSLGGILSGQHPIFIAQQATAQLDFPTDQNGVPVGYQIAANQMVTVEFHTINTTQAPLMVTGTAYIDTVPLSTNVTLSDIAFWGTEAIKIPPLSSWSTPVNFQAALPGTNSFALTTHQHHLGVQMQVWYGASGDTSDRVANGTNWANPPLVLLDPPLTYAAGSGLGLSYECTWDNTTAAEVDFGEGYNDEMCFLWHYYYPSQGFQLCTAGFCTTD